MSDLEKIEAMEYLNNKKEEKQTKKRKRKGFIVGSLVILLGGIAAISSLILPNKKNGDKNKNNTKIESVDDIEIDDISLADLGLEEKTNNKENSIYGSTTGNVDKNKIVEKDGTIWKDQTAANNSGEVGKITYDDKGGSLVVTPDGDVYDKDTGYEVKDENGNEIDSGSNSNGIPEGLVWDAELGAYVPKEELGLYTYADATYYDENGEVVIEKGMKIKKETLEKVKKYYTTEAPEKQTTNNTTESTTNTVVEQGVINPDGTYTISGVTFINKETYDAFVNGNYDEESVCYNENGVIYFRQKTR